ncbi:MMPL family transporter [Nonomuraea turkmeniaca]|uniref:MMPL family transporter n=1 Tax=Nonomuraea turkmeniaca TaxID=103838 RepID=A0A5S4FHC7_9ACTN|nr:MMPL family transporter [Nonomuraea turkmeniaca]TMR18287.1 MMPL family transporter [Nonomuraea turkmeniaca]
MTRTRRSKLVLWLTAALFLPALLAGHDVHRHLATVGTVPAGAQSERAEELLQDSFGGGTPHLILLVRSALPVDHRRTTAAARRLATRLGDDPAVLRVTSYWDGRDPALRGRDGRDPALRSRDGHGALIAALLSGDDRQRSETARRLTGELAGRHGPLTVQVTGEAQIRVEIQDRSDADLRTAELIAAPLTLVILLFVFGGLVAALLPVLVGGLAVVGTMAVLRGLTEVTEVSVFAMSIASMLGFALAVDFSLFILTRFREELAAGRDARAAVAVTMSTTGRAMAYSAATVTLSLSALLLFPFTMLRSIAFGGIAITVLAAVCSLVVLPAVLTLLGERVNSLSVRRRRRRRRRAGMGWFRVAVSVMRRPLLVAVPTALVLAVLASPFLGARFGTFDDRVLPPQAPAAQAARDLRQDFDGGGGVGAGFIVLPRVRDEWMLEEYARRVAAVEGVAQVSTVTGTYLRDTVISQADLRFTNGTGTWLAISSVYEPYSVGNADLAVRLREVPAPGEALVGGPGAELADLRQGIAGRLAPALALIAVVTFILVTALTRRIVLAVKSLLMNVLSLGATFGLLVHVFQDGHLRWLVGDFTLTGSIDALVPVMIFCVAFGLSMDYEIFLLARITEEHRRSGDTIMAVADGLQHTGRLFTSAAVIFAVVMAAMTTSSLAPLKMLGASLAVAVLLDATLIRTLLVPAVMRLAGRANWWTPWTTASAQRRELVALQGES